MSMPFDEVNFDGLIRRGVLDTSKQRSKNLYSLSVLTKFDDILGERWYIKGINSAGDFCYVQPKTVRYQLLLDDGTLEKYTYGVRYGLLVCKFYSDVLVFVFGQLLCHSVLLNDSTSTLTVAVHPVRSD